MTGAATAVLYWVLRRFTPSTVPFADGLTVALFLTAQFMMSKKIIQNWWFWIVGDVLVIGLYIYKQLYLTSALYAFFLAMCIAGLLEWQKASRETAVAADECLALDPHVFSDICRFILSGMCPVCTAPPPGLFSAFVANKTTCFIRRMGGPCATLGWPLGGPCVALGWPKGDPIHGRGSQSESSMLRRVRCWFFWPKAKSQ